MEFHFHRATPGGEGGVAVFELYGEAAASALRSFFKPRQRSLPSAGQSRLGDVVERSGEPIDEVIVSHLTAGGMWSRLQAFTLSVHGGVWMQKRLGALLREHGGVELDARGVLELAVKAKALDAIQAAAHELVLKARTERGARFLARQFTGELSGRLQSGLALLEEGRVSEVHADLLDLLRASRRAFRVCHPLRVLLAGRPNSGKSTLFNRLVSEERAVVTSLPGTTRDMLEELISVDGYPVILADSAGIRSPDSVGLVERQGIQKVLARSDDAVIYLVPYPWDQTEDDRAFLRGVDLERLLLVASLADLAPEAVGPPMDLSVSGLTGQGLEDLQRCLIRRWIDDDGEGGPEQEVPCAPFTEAQIRIVSTAMENLPGPPGVDVLRCTIIECLHSSWPEAASE